MAAINLITTPHTKPPSFHQWCTPHQNPPLSFFSFTKPKPTTLHLLYCTKPNSPTTPSLSSHNSDTDPQFDWFSQWYPLAGVCDLDERVPHGRRVLGMDVVLWWDKNEGEWRVFEDRCPHRLAPLSEGRIDGWGRLQCVYHGWCFGGDGGCRFVPQAPTDGPAVHISKKACVASYPCIVQNGIVWFWPNADPQNKAILSKKKPAYIPELDDPSFTRSMGTREIPYGYEILIENLMDPAHKVDREGGKPLNFDVETHDINGFLAKGELGMSKFIPPCVFYVYPHPVEDQSNGSFSSSRPVKELPTQQTQRKFLLIFICIPVSPGKSRLIWAFPRNFAVWIDQIVPRWMFHVGQNLILDSDLYLLHVEEHKIKEIGPLNWQKACYVPTKSDTLVVAYRKWLKKYSGGQVDWGRKFDGSLPPTPPREVLMDRYWSHVVNCSSCSVAYKGLNALEVVLQVASVGLIGLVAATKQGTISVITRHLAVHQLHCLHLKQTHETEVEGQREK
ncbi:Protochlorophyllide-dependent translocon component 52, chloroplastic-like protein [Drosera capensis]